jgi:hypothetical protein
MLRAMVLRGEDWQVMTAVTKPAAGVGVAAAKLDAAAAKPPAPVATLSDVTVAKLALVATQPA